MHRRQAIRDAAFALVDSLPGVVLAVKSRLHNWQVDEMPGIAVYTSGDPTEDSRLSDIARGWLDRTLRLAIDIRAKSDADGDPADDVDDLCVAVEQAMAAFPIGRGRAAMGIYLARTRIGISGEGDHRHSAASLEYEITYRTDIADPSA